ncbi:MAG: T9SS type A sorting domain-containing protein, partial [Bacteroidota bacterium]|nr:T9SS type A sorting domain-containing protein [Bacteroidota bacterium]
VDTVGLTYPIAIDTQKTKQFRIWFRPPFAASFTDTAYINSNAVNGEVLKIPLTGTGQNNLTTLGEIFWQGNIPDNPNTGSDNFKIVSMKEITDVNFDGVNDVVVSTDNYWTICYNGNSSVTADTLWKFNTRQSSTVSGSVIFEDAMQIMDDVNNDGIKDVVIGTGGNNELVYAVSGRTGKLLWTYGDSSITSDGDINGLCVTKDYNSDGKKDVLVAASGEGMLNGRHAGICLNAVNGSVIFYAAQNAEFTHSITATTSGGAIDFSNNGGPYGINGFNNAGTSTWTFPVASTVWNLKETQDINTDGNTDIASFIGFNGTITVLSGNNGSLIWSQNLGASIDGNIRFMDDLAGDGFRDIVSSGPRTLSRIDSRSSSILWTSSLDNNYIHGVDQLSDLTGNGIKEIVAGTQNSNLYVVNGDSGRILFTYNFGTATTNTVEQVSALKSVDGNVSSEFLGGSRTGKIICFSGGPQGIVGIKNSAGIIPDKFSLSQNYPNPFNPVTKIKFDVPSNVNRQTSDVKLVVYDALGKEVITIMNDQLSPGSYEVDFDGSNFSSGIYFYKIQMENFSEVKRMILLK